MTVRTITLTMASLALSACACACASTEPIDTTGEAPFKGPYTMPRPSEGLERQSASASEQGTENGPLPPPKAADPTHPLQAPAARPKDPATARRRAWLEGPFRCKAISSTRLRRCAFEKHEGGYRLRFQSSDVVCQDVEFDEGGDPSALLGCAGAWLRIPKRNRLRKARGQAVWSGSHRGWKWRDGEEYCCPGLWLEAPSSLAPQSRTSL